jgi:hypothetical protein
VKVAAKEGAADRIRVNAIAPAGVQTLVWDAVPMFAERAAKVGRDAAFAELAALAKTLGRYAKPEEIARQIGFLLSFGSVTTGLPGTTRKVSGWPWLVIATIPCPSRRTLNSPPAIIDDTRRIIRMSQRMPSGGCGGRA